MTAPVEPEAQTPPTRRHRRRRHLSTAVAAVLAVLLAFNSFSIWAHATVLTPSRFAQSATQLLDAPAVRTALADAITEKLVETGPSRLASFQTVLQPAIEQLLRTEVFRSIFRTAVTRAQDAILTEDGSAAAINLSAALGVLSGSLQVSNPSLAEAIPSGTDGQAVR